MFGLMKKHVLRAIDGTRWASRETKREAEAKIDNLHGSFVGTDLFFNYTFLQNRYGQVDITSDFFINVLQMFKHFRHNIYHFVNAQVDKDTYTWNLISYPFTVNAFHLQQLNSIGKKTYFLPNFTFSLFGSSGSSYVPTFEFDFFEKKKIRQIEGRSALLS